MKFFLFCNWGTILEKLIRNWVCNKYSFFNGWHCSSPVYQYIFAESYRSAAIVWYMLFSKIISFNSEFCVHIPFKNIATRHHHNKATIQHNNTNESFYLLFNRSLWKIPSIILKLFFQNDKATIHESCFSSYPHYIVSSKPVSFDYHSSI